MASNIITSDGKDLDSRYLAIGGKAASATRADSAAKADSATTATNANYANSAGSATNVSLTYVNISSADVRTPNSGKAWLVVGPFTSESKGSGDSGWSSTRLSMAKVLAPNTVVLSTDRYTRYPSVSLVAVRIQ